MKHTFADDPAFNDTMGTNSLTKREFFAAMAMQGILAGHYSYLTGNVDLSIPVEVAKEAVINANILIEELNKE